MFDYIMPRQNYTRQNSKKIISKNK